MKNIINIIASLIRYFLLPIDVIRTLMFCFLWIWDGYYTLITISQMVMGIYPYHFWGTLEFLVFTLGAFICISCTCQGINRNFIIWDNLSADIQTIVGAFLMLNVCYISVHLPADMTDTRSWEEAQLYAKVDVALIIYCTYFFCLGCYNGRNQQRSI